MPFSRDTRSHRQCQEVGRTCSRQDTARSRHGAPGKQLWECLATVLQMVSVPKENHSKEGSHLWAGGGSREAQPGAGPRWQLEQQTNLYKPLLLQRAWPETPPRPVDIIHRTMTMAEGRTGHLTLEMNKQETRNWAVLKKTMGLTHQQ